MKDEPSQQRSKRWFAVRISWKLLGATAVVGAVAAIIAIVGLKRIQTLNQNLTQIVNFLATNAKLASLIKRDLITVTRAERNMMLAQSEDGTKRFADAIDEVLTAMDQRIEELRPVLDDENQHQLDSFTNQWAIWRENHQDVRRFTAINSDIQARNISVGDSQQAIDRLKQSLQVVSEQSDHDLATDTKAKDELKIVAALERLKRTAAISCIALELQRAEKDLILAPSKDEIRRYEDLITLLTKNLEAQVESLESAMHDNDTRAMVAIKMAVADYLNANQKIRVVAGEKSNSLAYHYVYDIGAPIAAECEALLDVLIERNEKQMQSYRRAGQQSYRDARSTLLGISIFGICLSVAISFYTGQQVARRLNLLTQHAQNIQNTGDLSKPTPNLGSDEVGLLAESFDHMRESLHEQKRSLSEHAVRLAELTKTLESKNREMEQFVYTVSHDLKSPLVSCKGLLGLLKEDVDEGDQDAVRDSLERLDLATDQLNQIIDDLLMLSRIGRKKLELTEINVVSLVDELLEELEDRITATQVTIDVDGRMPTVIADESDLRRVFENLITNALKYGNRESEFMITIGGTKTNEEIRYFVRDNGPGIEAKYHQRIFGLFQRLETGSPGTGLGLASVAKIMNMHGGRVWVESEVGQGATFWIALPDRPHSA